MVLNRKCSRVTMRLNRQDDTRIIFPPDGVAFRFRRASDAIELIVKYCDRREEK